MERQSYYVNHHRYVYAPRNMSDAFRDVEYASAIFVYKGPTYLALISLLQWFVVGILIAFMMAMTVHSVWSMIA